MAIERLKGPGGTNPAWRGLGRKAVDVMAASRAMRRPLIATHIAPDGDALGSSLAMAIYLKKHGQASLIFLSENKKIPVFFSKMLAYEELNVVSSITTMPHDGIIMLDVPETHRLEEPVRKNLAGGIKAVEIDHHLKRESMTSPDLSLTRNDVSSTSEILAELMEGEIDQSIARCLLAGIITDTKNMMFMVGKKTEAIVKQLEGIAAMTRDEIYTKVMDMSDADKELISKYLEASPRITATISDIPYNIRWAVVRHEDLTSGHRNWRKPLQEAMGLTNDTDIVILIYYEASSGKYRGSISAYNKGTRLNLIPAAEALDLNGGGHPGAVGFDFPLADYGSNFDAVDHIINILSANHKIKQVGRHTPIFPLNISENMDIGPHAPQFVYLINPNGISLFSNPSSQLIAHGPYKESFGVLLNNNAGFDRFRGKLAGSSSFVFDPRSGYFAFAPAKLVMQHRFLCNSFSALPSSVTEKRSEPALEKEWMIKGAIKIGDDGSIIDFLVVPLIPATQLSSKEDDPIIEECFRKFGLALKSLDVPDDQPLKDYNKEKSFMDYLLKRGILTLGDLIRVFGHKKND